MSAPSTIDEYITPFPKPVQELLKQMRATIRAAAPTASEKIGYGIPTFVLNGNLVHFAAFKHHVGFYPGPTGMIAFKQALSAYKSAKGSVQFPLDQPLPLGLVTRIVKFRAKQNLASAKNKAARPSRASSTRTPSKRTPKAKSRTGRRA